jgi:integrase/recombinase XerC/integrase/recombinase XerD
VRAYLAETTGLAPATRKRKRAAVASFCRWAVRHELLDANPMDRIDTVKVPKRLPRPATAGDVGEGPRRDLPAPAAHGPAAGSAA